MYKILLVDDEILVRVGLKTYIPWEDYGFTIAGEAGNGREALEKCSVLNPDVILTDIKMPYIDGIQLLEALKKTHPHIRSVILSCYDDFTLVKQAMKLGASEYILKPAMQKEDLIQLLQNLRNEIAEMEAAHAFPSRSAPSMKEPTTSDILYSLIVKGDAGAYEAQERNPVLLHLEDAFHCIVLFSIDRIHNIISRHNHSYEQFNNAVRSITGNSVKTFGLQFFSSLQNYAILFSARNASADEIRNTALQSVEKLQKDIQNYLNCSISAVISNAGFGSAALNRLFKECEDALAGKFYRSPGKITFFSEQTVLRNVPIDSLMKLESESIAHWVSQGEAELLSTYFSDRFRMIGSIMPATIEEVRKLCIQMLFLMEAGNHLDEEARSVFNGSNYYEYIKNEEFFENIAQFVLQLAAKAFSCNTPASGVKECDNLIKKGLKYIERNYAGELTLKSIADHVGLSRNYFCSLFKQQTGLHIVDCIAEVRMKKAGSLLKDPTMKIYEVSKAVGIENTRYFCSLFKKHHGVTPMEFKKYAGERLQERKEKL